MFVFGFSEFHYESMGGDSRRTPVAFVLLVNVDLLKHERNLSNFKTKSCFHT